MDRTSELKAFEKLLNFCSEHEASFKIESYDAHMSWDVQIDEAGGVIAPKTGYSEGYNLSIAVDYAIESYLRNQPTATPQTAS